MQPTAGVWAFLRKAAQIKPLATKIQPSRERPSIDIDEMWSFVRSKANHVWVWVAIARQTRKIVGLAFGDRAEKACRRVWQSLPPDYRKRAILYTDGLSSYQTVVPAQRHRVVDQKAAQTTCIDRFHNTLRQRLARLVRKTLSFSTDAALHEARVRLFVDDYNSMLSV